MGGEGKKKEGMLFQGNPREERFLCWETCVDCCCLCPDLFFPFFLWWPIVAQEADGILILPHSGWGLKCGALFPLCSERTDSLTTVHYCWEKKATHDFQDFFFFFQTKVVEEDASSQLSRSIGIYSSGHLISI